MSIFKRPAPIGANKVDESVTRETELYKRERQLSIDVSMLDAEKKVYDINSKIEHATEKLAEIPKIKLQEEIELDARIEYKKKLLAEIVDNKDTEIRLLREANILVMKTKDEMIELLKAQVEILTAKLTEIKISDAHIHVQAAISDSQK